MTAFFKPAANAPVAKGRLPGEDDDDDDAPREETPAQEEEEEENLDDL